MARLMIVDDAPFMRTTLKNIVIDAGYDVVGEATNGHEAIALYKELRPDLVIMDITMPEMNGIAALEKIKAINPKAKIVICSAMGQQNLVIDAIQNGAIDFISKPFVESRIQEAIHRALNK